MSQRLNLLVLRSRDVEATRRFYECVGITFETHRHGDGPEHYAAECGGTVFEIYPASSAGADSAGVGFAVADLEAVHDRFAIEGFTPGDVADRPWGMTFVLRDPDGRRVEMQAE